MKKLVSSIIALTVSASSLFGQNLTGVWQGTLNQGRAPQRIVIRIYPSENGSNSKALLYSIDDATAPIPASEVVVRGSTVRMLFPGMIAKYEGKLSADTQSITGEWSQGSAPSPLTFVRATNESAWAIPAPPPSPRPMASDADPKFEVATVKPSAPDRKGRSIRVQGRRLVTTETTLGYLIAFAYGIHRQQIIDAPAWLDSDKYDVTGEPEGDGQPSEQQWKTMVRKLLTERFQLAFHREKKEIPVYVLTLDKKGPRLTRSAGDSDRLAGMGFRGRPGAFFAHNGNMADFAGFLQTSVVDRPVLDKTGISGRFDFTLDWTPDDFELARLGIEQAPSSPAANANPDLFTALKQQLGLRLDAGRTQAEVLVMVRVERPSEN